MLVEIILAILAGLIVGSITGLTPGIHINMVSAIVLGFIGAILAYVSPLGVAIFLVAVAITHTFVDYIPSVFLGAPNEDTVLSVLPGHELLKEGRGYEAVVYALYGGLIGLALVLLFSPIFLITLNNIYTLAEKIMPLILIISSIFLIYFEKTSRVWAILIFILSGILGLVTFNLSMKEVLLPIFTGLFGISSMITSLNLKHKIPEQRIKKIKYITLKKKSYLKVLGATILASPLCSFLPGMGSGQAAVIGSEIVEEINKKEFLVLLGSINVLVTGLSFVTLYVIDKARTGVAVTVGKLIELTLNELYIITATIFISGIFAFFITLFLAKRFSKLITKINYRKLSLGIIEFLVLINFLLCGWLGLIILAVSTSIGLLCIYVGVRRTHMLGCIIIPAIVLSLI